MNSMIMAISTLLNGSNCCTLTNNRKVDWKLCKLASWELCHNTEWPNTDAMKMWQELQTSDINSRIKNYETKQLHLGRMSSSDFLNCAQTTNPEAQKTIKDAHIKAGENIIKFIVLILNLETKVGLLEEPKPCCCRWQWCLRVQNIRL